MKASGLLAASALAALVLAPACGGTTGDQLIGFNAYASGVAGAGEPFSVNGYTIQLTSAQMYVGAVYVNEAPAGTGDSLDSPVCINSGTYCAQVPGGVEVNLLSTTPEPFAVMGNGTADLGQSWEIYLVDGDVNTPDNTGFGVPDTADLQGTATRESDGKVFSWAATVTINQSNRGEPIENQGTPGNYPICKKRIIELGGPQATLFQGASLRLTIDPRGWFNLPIDFSSLPSVASTQCELDTTSDFGDAQYCIPDSSLLPGSTLGSQQGINLFTGIATAGSAYNLTYQKSP